MSDEVEVDCWSGVTFLVGVRSCDISRFKSNCGVIVFRANYGLKEEEWENE